MLTGSHSHEELLCGMSWGTHPPNDVILREQPRGLSQLPATLLVAQGAKCTEPQNLGFFS